MNFSVRHYQYIGPLVLTPVSFTLWWREYQNVPQVLSAWLLPILWAYIVPGIGTNLCKMWEFDVRWKWGRFRPHHGFVFGSATATIAWTVHSQPAQTIPEILRYAVILCSVLGFWNLLYEVWILRAGILKVYNHPWVKNRGEEAIAFDYAPWFFGGFGAAHGLVIGILEYWVTLYGLPGLMSGLLYNLGGLVFVIALPVLGFMYSSFQKHGHCGIHPQTKE